jgi:hypothetical protein
MDAVLPPAVGVVTASTRVWTSVDDYVAPRSIEGIEVYRGAGRTVGHFHDPRGCGMVRRQTIGIVLGTLLGLFLILI